MQHHLPEGQDASALPMTMPADSPPGRAPVEERELNGNRVRYEHVAVKRGSLWRDELPEGTSDELRRRGAGELGPVLALCLDLFETYWDHIVFGPCIQGAIFELSLSRRPRVDVRGGFVIVDLPGHAGHLHLCVDADAPGRACAKVAFFTGHSRDTGEPRTWGIRFWNGLDQQMMTVFMSAHDEPGSEAAEAVKGPAADQAAIAAWHELRRRYIEQSGALTGQLTPL